MGVRIRAALLVSSDLERAEAFYRETLGLKRTRSGADLILFELDGSALALVRKEAAAGLTGLVLGEPSETPSQFLMIQAAGREEVAGLLESARAAGGTVLREAGENAWGGFSGNFTDPDGHVWTVAHDLEFYRS